MRECMQEDREKIVRKRIRNLVEGQWRGELFRCFYCFSRFLAFRLVFPTNLELAHFSPSPTFIRHAAAASMPLSSTAATASHLSHERNGDKVTLRNCFPQADERELSPTRASLSALRILLLLLLLILPSVYQIPKLALASYQLLRDFFLLLSKRASFHPRSIPFGFTTRDVDQREEKSREFTRSRCRKEFYAIVTLSREK